MKKRKLRRRLNGLFDTIKIFATFYAAGVMVYCVYNFQKIDRVSCIAFLVSFAWIAIFLLANKNNKNIEIEWD